MDTQERPPVLPREEGQAPLCLVTGATRGIGGATAIRLADAGFDVVVHYRRQRDLAEANAERIRSRGRQAYVIQADLESVAEVQSLTDEIASWDRPLNGLVCSAAATAFKTAHEVQPHHLERTYRIVIGSLYQLVQQLSPVMPRGSSIVTISGTGASHVIPRYSLLGSAKAAQEALVRYLAVELAPVGIRVNGISPGIVATDSTLYYMQGDEGPLMQEARRLTPVGRPGTPEDIAAIVAFLLSPDSAFMVGQVLVADGGLTLGMPALYPGSDL